MARASSPGPGFAIISLQYFHLFQVLHPFSTWSRFCHHLTAVIFTWSRFWHPCCNYSWQDGSICISYPYPYPMLSNSVQFSRFCQPFHGSAFRLYEVIYWCGVCEISKFHSKTNGRKIKFHIETIPAALWNGDASSDVRHPALKLDHHRRSQQTKVFFVKKNWKILWYLILLLPVPAWVPLWIDKCYLIFGFLDLQQL